MVTLAPPHCGAFSRQFPDVGRLGLFASSRAGGSIRLPWTAGRVDPRSPVTSKCLLVLPLLFPASTLRASEASQIAVAQAPSRHVPSVSKAERGRRGLNAAPGDRTLRWHVVLVLGRGGSAVSRNRLPRAPSAHRPYRGQGHAPRPRPRAGSAARPAPRRGAQEWSSD